MPSIRRIQKRRAYNDIAKLLYSEGVKPTDAELLNRVSEYFSKNPIGLPLPMVVSDIAAEASRSDPDALNELSLRTIINVETLFQLAIEQADFSMALMTSSRDALAMLDKKRRKVLAELDDIMHSMFNTDGYYYAISETYSDLSLTDRSLSTAYVDVEEGVATLPMISYLSRRLPYNQITPSSASVTMNGQGVSHATRTPIIDAFDGLTNTAWSLEVSSASRSRVTAVLPINISTVEEISKIKIEPYGVTPSQWSVEYGFRDASGALEFRAFGDRVRTTTDSFSLTNRPVHAESLRFTINKDDPDYETDGIHRYIIGAKNIEISYQAFDARGSIISQPLNVPNETGVGLIDAVSITTEHTKPSGTNLTFYVAEDDPSFTEVSDFEWRQIQPVDEKTTADKTVVRFGGTKRISYIVKSDPTEERDLIKTPLDSVNPDMRMRNPTTAILEGANLYRVTKIEDAPLLNSVKLEEGINSVRIYHAALDDNAVNEIDWWANGIGSARVLESRIDSGNGFFYGGAVGESGRSILVESFVEVSTEIEQIFADLKKNDANSRSWKVRAFLNGAEVGMIDHGEPSALITWPFKRGINHVVLLINIPKATKLIPHPYVGSITLMNGHELTGLGNVRLGTLDYVDPFDMQFNQKDGASTFTISGDEVLSRREPTGDLRFSYNVDTGGGPSSVRFRADLERGNDYSTLTPELSSYRIRFSYEEGN